MLKHSCCGWVKLYTFRTGKKNPYCVECTHAREKKRLTQCVNIPTQITGKM